MYETYEVTANGDLAGFSLKKVVKKVAKGAGKVTGAVAKVAAQTAVSPIRAVTAAGGAVGIKPLARADAFVNKTANKAGTAAGKLTTAAVKLSPIGIATGNAKSVFSRPSQKPVVTPSAYRNPYGLTPGLNTNAQSIGIPKTNETANMVKQVALATQQQAAAGAATAAAAAAAATAAALQDAAASGQPVVPGAPVPSPLVADNAAQRALDLAQQAELLKVKAAEQTQTAVAATERAAAATRDPFAIRDAAERVAYNASTEAAQALAKNSSDFMPDVPSDLPLDYAADVAQEFQNEWDTAPNSPIDPTSDYAPEFYPEDAPTEYATADSEGGVSYDDSSYLNGLGALTPANRNALAAGAAAAVLSAAVGWKTSRKVLGLKPRVAAAVGVGVLAYALTRAMAKSQGLSGIHWDPKTQNWAW